MVKSSTGRRGWIVIVGPPSLLGCYTADLTEAGPKSFHEFFGKMALLCHFRCDECNVANIVALFFYVSSI